MAASFVAAAPAGARVRARLRVSPEDEAVLWAAGRHLGMLAGRDLAARCAEERLDARGQAVSRTARDPGKHRQPVPHPEARRPTRPPAATRHQDQAASPDHRG